VQTEIAQVQIPLPLRNYPRSPILVGQSGRPHDRMAATIAGARQWDYRFDFSAGSAAQDTEHVIVTFGIGAGSLGAEVAVSTADLFNWLATFSEAYPSLKNDLSLLVNLPPGGNPGPTAAYAAQSLGTIAGGVASALSAGRTPAVDASAGAGDTYGYQMRTLSNGQFLQQLQLDFEQGPSGAPHLWPDVLIKSPNGSATGPDAGFLMLTSEGSGFYRFPADVALDEQVTYRFRFEQRDVIENTDAWGGVYVDRNAQLVANGPLGMSGIPGPVSTNPAFVYKTPLVRFIDPMVPLIDDSAFINLADLGGPTGPAGHLARMLNQALGDPIGASASLANVEILCSYGVPLKDDLRAVTPILLAPITAINSSNEGPFIDSLALSLGQWKNGSGVAGDTGVLLFEVTAFAEGPAQNDGAPGPASLLPVLRLRNLELPMSDIIWD
jgi:hypothetical protein